MLRALLYEPCYCAIASMLIPAVITRKLLHNVARLNVKAVPNISTVSLRHCWKRIWWALRELQGHVRHRCGPRHGKY